MTRTDVTEDRELHDIEGDVPDDEPPLIDNDPVVATPDTDEENPK